MKCKQVEKLIIHSDGEAFSENEKFEMDSHIQSCNSCSGLAKNIRSIRNNKTILSSVEPSDSLVESTIELCHSELRQKDQNVVHFSNAKMTTPISIRATIIAILTFCIIWFFPVLKEFIQENIISDHTIWLFTIIVQNIIMLLFAPIIFSKTRQKPHSFGKIAFS